MRIVQIIPGSGESFYCENCIRDNAVLRALRSAGHDAMSVPLYLPPLVDGAEAGPAGPIFFGAINVCLQQKFSLFRRTPRWIDRLFDVPGLLRWLGRRGGTTNPAELGEMTLSMLRGEDGRQVKELNRLVEWLAGGDRPDMVVLSNVLLAGLARPIREALASPVVCLLQDEDFFLDGLPQPQRSRAWETLSQRVAGVDAFVAVSNYYAEVMCRRLGLPAERVRVVHGGIATEGYEPAAAPPDPPAIGYLSRMCQEKGLDTLVEAFVILKRNPRLAGLKLRAAGGRTGDDDAFVDGVRRRLDEAGLVEDAQLLPNLRLADRQAFLRGLSVLSVPERHGEAFGLYVLEALACGVPVVLPSNGAAPELVEATGGGLLCERDNPDSLAAGLEKLLTDPDRARALGRRGREAVLTKFTAERSAQALVSVFREVASRPLR